MELMSAAVAWAANGACRIGPIAYSTLGQRFCSREDIDLRELIRNLSPKATVLLPKDEEFAEASRRWNWLDEPKPTVVVIPSVALDVAMTVQYANKHNELFLAVGGHHGAASSLGRMEGGLEIILRNLDSIELSSDGKTAKIGGGILTKTLIDVLWEAGKQTVTGTCECTGFLGPGLGAGHGWLQGHHGLIADQFISMEVVLADGSNKTVTAESDPDLWWALRGAGHNFVIVTSVTVKTYDIQHRDWARETMTFTGDKIEAVFQAINDKIFRNGKQDEDVVVWSSMLNAKEFDSQNPVIIVYLLQEGVKAVNAKYSAALKSLGPVRVENTPGTYTDLAAWTRVSMDDPPCQKLDSNNIRFPLYLESYNITAVRKVYDMFAAALRDKPEFANSMILFENYPRQGVQKVKNKDSAFAFRNDGILAAPLINFRPGNKDVDGLAIVLGEALRTALHNGSNRKTMHTYVNYAFRDSKDEMFGEESWRQEKLAALKAKYDPIGRFNFYNSVV